MGVGHGGHDSPVSILFQDFPPFTVQNNYTHAHTPSKWGFHRKNGKKYNNLEYSGHFRQKGILVQRDHLLNAAKQVLLSFWILMCETQKEDAVLLQLQTQLVNAHKQHTLQITALHRRELKRGYMCNTQDMTHGDKANCHTPSFNKGTRLNNKNS
jgi:hypothetical protein